MWSRRCHSGWLKEGRLVCEGFQVLHPRSPGKANKVTIITARTSYINIRGFFYS